MLLPWSDELRVFLHPRQVVLLRMARGSRRRVIHQQALPCAETVGTPAWQAPVAALKAVLHDQRWRGARPRLVLSNHFAHYALVPWSAQLSEHGERQAYLRHCFGLAYGEPARQWDLRMSESGVDMPSLASGIDRALIDALRDALGAAGMPPAAIHPHLMVGANASRRWLGRGKVWFAIVEHGRLCLSLLDNGVWTLVRNQAADADWSRQLETLLARESVLPGDHRRDWPLVVYWPERAAGSPAPKMDGRKVTLVPGQAAGTMLHDDGAACRLALWA